MEYLGYPATYKDSVQYIVLQHICTTCLSTERKLSRLDDQQRILMNTLGIKMKHPQKVCWECHAMIKNMLRFKHTAAKAQGVLLRRDWKALDNLGSMSRLGKPKSIKLTSIIPINQQISLTQLPDSQRETVIISPENPPPLQPLGALIQNENVKWIQIPPVTPKQPASISSKMPALQLVRICPKMPALQPATILPKLQQAKKSSKPAPFLPGNPSPDTRYLITLEKFIQPSNSSFTHRNTARAMKHKAHIPEVRMNKKVRPKRPSVPKWHNAYTQIEIDETPARNRSLLKHTGVKVKDVIAKTMPEKIEDIEMMPGRHGEDNNTDNNSANPQCLDEVAEIAKSLEENKDNSPEIHVYDKTDNAPVSLQYFKELLESDKLLDKTEEEMERLSTITEIPATSRCLNESLEKDGLQKQHKEEINKQSTYYSDTLAETSAILPEIHIDYSNSDNDPTKLQCFKVLLEKEDSLDKKKEENEIQSTDSDIHTDSKQSLPETNVNNNTNNDPVTLRCFKELLESEDSLYTNEERIKNISVNTDIGTENIEIRSDTPGDNNNTGSYATLQCLKKSQENEESLYQNKDEIDKRVNNVIPTENIKSLPEAQVYYNTDDYSTALQSLKDLLEREGSPDKKLKEINKKSTNADIPTENIETLTKTYSEDNNADNNLPNLQSLENLPEKENTLNENKEDIEKQSTDTDIPTENVESLPETRVDDNYTDILQSLEKLLQSDMSQNEQKNGIEKQSTDTNISPKNIESRPESHFHVNITDNDPVILHCFKKSPESEDSLYKNKEEIENGIGNTDIQANKYHANKRHGEDNTTENNTVYLHYLEELPEIKKQSTNGDIPSENIKTLAETYGDANNIDNNVAILQCFKECLVSKDLLYSNEKGIGKQNGNTAIENMETLSDTHSSVNNTDNSASLQCLKASQENEEPLHENKEAIEKQLNTVNPIEKIEIMPETFVDDNSADNNPATLHCFEELHVSEESLDKNKEEIEKQSRNTDTPSEHIETLSERHGEGNNTDSHRTKLQYLEELPEGEKSQDVNKEQNIEKQSPVINITTENIQNLPESHANDYNTDNDPPGSLALQCLRKILEMDGSRVAENIKEINKKSADADISTESIESLTQRQSEINNADNNPAKLQYLEELPEGEKSLDGNKEQNIEKQSPVINITTENIQNLPESHVNDYNTDNDPPGSLALQCLKNVLEMGGSRVVESVKEINKKSADVDIPTESIETLRKRHGEDTYIHNNHANLHSLEELPENENKGETVKLNPVTDISTESLTEIYVDDNSNDNDPAPLECLQELEERDGSQDGNLIEIYKKNADADIRTENMKILPKTNGDDDNDDNNLATVQWLKDLNEKQGGNTDIATQNIETLPDAHSEGNNTDNPATLQCLRESRGNVETLDENKEEVGKQLHTDIPTKNIPEKHEKDINSVYDPANLQCFEELSESYKFIEEEIEKQISLEQQGKQDEHADIESVEQQENYGKKRRRKDFEERYELDPNNEKHKGERIHITRVFSKISTNKNNPKNNSNKKNYIKCQPVNVKEKQQLTVRRITAEPRRIIFDIKQINSVEHDKNRYLRSIPEQKFNEVTEFSDAYKTVLKDHPYCKLKCFECQATNKKILEISNRPREFRQLQKRNETKRMRLTEATNNTADECFIQANVIQNIIDNFEFEINAIDDWDTSEPDNSGVLKLNASTSTAQETFSFDKIWSCPSSVVESDNESDVEIDVENIEPLEKKYNYPILVTVKVEQCNSESVERRVEFDENYDWTVDRYRSKFAEYDCTTDTASETSNLDLTRETNEIKQRSESFKSGYTASETSNLDLPHETNGIKQRNESFKSGYSVPIFEDYLNKPLEYHYENSPSENAQYSYDCLANVDTNNQAPTDGSEMNSFTICLPNAWSDFMIGPTDQQTDDPKHQETNINSTNFDEVRNLSPDLLEPLYYTNWEDQTFAHVLRSDSKEASKSNRKDRHKEDSKIDNCDDQFGNPLPKKRRRRKRKFEEAQKKALDSEDFTRLKSSKKKKIKLDSTESPLDDKELPLENKEPPPKNVESTPEKNEENALEGINYEQLLPRHVLTMGELKKKRRRTKTNVNKVGMSRFRDCNLDVPQCTRTVSQIDDLKSSDTTASDEINKKHETSVTDNKIFDYVLRTRPMSTSYKPAQDKLEKFSIGTEKSQRRVSASSFQEANKHMNIYDLRTLQDGEIETLRENAKIATKFKNSKYKCVKCVRVFMSASILAAHIERYHKTTSGKFVCKVCECRYKNKPKLRIHTKTHESCFKCQLCSCEHLFFLHLTDHFKKVHRETYAQVKKYQPKRTSFKCKTCGIQYKFRKTVQQHQKNIRLGLPCIRRKIISINLGLTENKVSLTENNLGLTENKLSLPENNLGLTENKLSLTENNLGLTENKLSLTENKSSLTQKNLSVMFDNLSNMENNINLKENNLNSTENDCILIENNLSCTENNINLTENNLNSTENNLNSTENDCILIENNLSCTENKISLTENKNTCVCCNKNFRTNFAYNRHMESVHSKQRYEKLGTDS